MPRKAKFNDNSQYKFDKAFISINNFNNTIMKKISIIETNQDKLNQSIYLLKNRIEKVENMKAELLKDLDIISNETKSLSISIMNLDSDD